MTPHFGLLDETKMGREEAILMRSKLHYRCGIRRMTENKVSAGIATIYDAMLSGMRWYVLTNQFDELGDDAEQKLENDHFIISLIQQAGIIESSVDMQFIDKILNNALLEEDVSKYHDQFMAQVELILTKLEILPFDESELPPEDPTTF